MPTRLLLEGPDIESLLSRVRDEHGAGARIVSADKVRTGGLAGFFAKEKFEVSVEVDERSNGGRHAAPEPPARSGRHAAGTDADDDTPRGAASLADLAEAVDNAERKLASTGSATTYTPRHVAGKAAPPERAVDLPAPAAVEPAPHSAPSTFADVLAGIAPELPAPQPAPFKPAAPPAQISRPDVPAPAAAVLPAPRPSAGRHAVLADAHAVTSAAASPAAAPADTFLRLRELGLPPVLAQAAGTTGDPYTGLVEALATLPQPPRPPSRAGDVLVVAGDGARALALATEVAVGLRIALVDVLYAGAGPVVATLPAPRRLSGPAEAERRARYMHRADVPHVVAVEAPVDGESADWARSVADALGATAVWAVVDATCKPADLRAHLRLLGPTAAIVADNTEGTADPASVLELGLPVALLDGRPATPAAWAALLCSRLERRR